MVGPHFYIFLWGSLGGVFTELLPWFNRRQEIDLPPFTQSLFYWFVTLLMILCGGLLALAYAQSGAEINAILAINVGASAPLILKSFATQTPPIPPGRVN